MISTILNKFFRSPKFSFNAWFFLLLIFVLVIIFTFTLNLCKMNFDKTIIQRVLNKAYNNYLNTALVRLWFVILSIVTFSFYLEICTMFETHNCVV